MDNSRYLTIKNKNSTAVIDRVGGQLVSYMVDGVEVMYNGATSANAQWKGTAKNLFPNPGPMGNTNPEYGDLKVFEQEDHGKNTKFTEYYHNGGIYKAEQHGFLQKFMLNVQGHNRSDCTLVLSADQETVKYYPYDFKYYVGFSLDKNGLNYMSIAKNNDNKDMLAGMGWHPAFNLHGDASRYKIIIENLQKDDSCSLTEGELEIYNSVIQSGKSAKFNGIKSADIVLVYTTEKGKDIPYIKMHTEEPYLVLWSKPKENNSQQDFICIEPWNTTPRQLNNLTEQHKTKLLSYEGGSVIKPNEQSILNASVSVSGRYLDMIKQISNQKQ